MQYLSIVNVLQSQAYLSKPIQNMVFAPILQRSALFISNLILFLDFTLQVTAVCKVHDIAHFALFRFVDLLEPDNVWML